MKYMHQFTQQVLVEKAATQIQRKIFCLNFAEFQFNCVIIEYDCNI